MTSRQLVLVLLGVTAACGPRGTTVSPVGPVQSELSRDEQAGHVLSRLAYGARPGELDRVRKLGVERWIALQLHPERVPDRAMDSVIATYRTLNVSSSELSSSFRTVRMARRDTARAAMAVAIREIQRSLQLALGEVTAAKLSRAVVSERQLYEQMVDFWENHFSVFAGKGQTRLYIPSYDREVIRPHALGRFRDLLGGVAQSPAMLFYLDNWQSAADSNRATLASLQVGERLRIRPAIRPIGARPQLPPVPPGGDTTRARRPPRGLNENYARELMELHTLGVDGGYTQQDVVEVARALTGWSIDPAQGSFVFRPAMHDADEKRVLGVRLPSGRGMQDGEDVLDILARHPSTARHLTRKLVVRFVSDSAPSALVDRCASVFSKSDGDIRQTLRCVVTSPEFFSRRAYRSKVKTPFELVASALRAVNARPDSTPRSAQIVARLGQPIFGRQTPDGWPDRADEWMNTGALMTRVNFGLAVAAGRIPGVRLGDVDATVAATLTTPDFQRR